MRIRLITITHKLPTWVSMGYDEYIKRFPRDFPVELIEVPLEKRHPSSNTARIIERESEKLLAQCKPHSQIIALDNRGQHWSTETLATNVKQWQTHGDTINLIIGGPDGLSAECLTKANAIWSLSNLTFPHFLVRIIIAEQLYRAISIIQHHPYHR